jgi:hypothetical protein
MLVVKDETNWTILKEKKITDFRVKKVRSGSGISIPGPIWPSYDHFQPDPDLQHCSTF